MIELEDSDSNDGEDNGADLAIIAVDSSDEEVEDGQGSKVASQAIVEVEDSEVMKKLRMVKAPRLLLRPSWKWKIRKR